MALLLWQQVYLHLLPHYHVGIPGTTHPQPIDGTCNVLQLPRLQVP